MLLKEIYKLDQFRNEIGDEEKEKGHALTTKRKYWDKEGLQDYLQYFDLDELTITRQELYNLADKSPDDMIMKTILWGYRNPGIGGGRIGKNTVKNVENIKAALQMAKEEGIQDWQEHYELLLDTKDLEGIGLSTYSKFLTFMGINVEGVPALIVDRHVVNFLRSGEFPEFDGIKNKIPSDLKKAAQHYPAIIKYIHEVAKKVGVPAPNLEMFIYQWRANGGKLRKEMFKRMNLTDGS